MERSSGSHFLSSAPPLTWFALGAAAVVLWILVALQLALHVRRGLPTDFEVYRNAAINMLHGRATYQDHFTSVHLNFTYPPVALLLLSVLTVGSAHLALAMWWLLNCVALVFMVTLVLQHLVEIPRRRAVLVALVLCGASCLFLEPVRSSLDFGQINFFLMLAIIADILVVRSARRGALTGLVAAIKLTPLLYVSYFALRRSPASILRALGTLLAATAVAWIVLPTDSTLFWLHQAFSPGHKGGARGTANQSWFGLTSHYSTTTSWSMTILWLALCALSFLVGLYLAQCYLKSGRRLEAFLALALTELLISPISWTHHWSWIIVLPVILIAKWREDPGVSAAMVLMLSVAVVTPYRWHRYSWYNHGYFRVLPGYSLLLAGVVLMVTMAATEWRKDAARRHTTVSASI